MEYVPGFSLSLSLCVCVCVCVCVCLSVSLISLSESNSRKLNRVVVVVERVVQQNKQECHIKVRTAELEDNLRLLVSFMVAAGVAESTQMLLLIMILRLVV